MQANPEPRFQPRWDYCLLSLRESGATLTHFKESGPDVQSVVLKSGESTGTTVGRTLCDLGRRGWEMVSVHGEGRGGFEAKDFYFKKIRP